MVDFNWENYDTMVGVEGHTASVVKAMELALSYDPATAVKATPVITHKSPDMTIPHEKIEALRVKLGDINAKLEAGVKLNGKDKFAIMAEKYETEHLLQTYGVDSNG